MSSSGAGDTGTPHEKRPSLLPLYDANIFCGNYPFRRLPCDTPANLAAYLDQEQIARCVATPFESIFYRQPWEGLLPWLAPEQISVRRNQSSGEQHPYLFWLVVNPLMPGWAEDVARADAHPMIAGLRLWPRYHGYDLAHPALKDVTDAAAEFDLPINLSARLLDDRLHPAPLRTDAPLSMTAVADLLAQTSHTRWLLSMFYMAELKQCADAVSAHRKVWIDIGCSKPFELWVDDIRAAAPIDRVVMGTGAPLYYHMGTRISLQRSELTEVEKTDILSGNLEVVTTRHKKEKTSAVAQGEPHQ